MSNQPDRGVETFLEAWAPEFARSVEMFRGEQPAVTGTPLKGNRADQQFAVTDEVLWWQQQLECGGSYSIWIGAPAETWNELAAGLAETPEDRRSMYLEILGPSLQGVAHALSSGRDPRIVCKEGAERNAPASAVHMGALNITMQGRLLPPIVVGLDAPFANLIAPAPEAVAEEASSATPAGMGYESRLMFKRLIELELPISIVLGRAVVPVRDVLKLSAGSLIDMDRRVGDLVEIVVHNVVVARGEVVAVKGNYGVRVKEVISRNDRIALQASVRKESAPAATIQ
jgi:flagellar motor switch protein FliN/FliY